MSRIEKVNEQLRREISQTIQQDLADPRLQFVSITKVDASKDLRNARVYFSVLGNAKNKESAQKGLDSAKGILRKYIGQRMKMRYTPDLNFYFDDSINVSFTLEETIKEIHEQAQTDIADDQKI